MPRLSKRQMDLLHHQGEVVVEGVRLTFGPPGLYGYGQLEPMLKTQEIRLVDVFVIGPLMVYAAAKLPKKHSIARIALQVFGMSTIFYNLENWKKYRKIENLHG